MVISMNEMDLKWYRVVAYLCMTCNKFVPNWTYFLVAHLTMLVFLNNKHF